MTDYTEIETIVKQLALNLAVSVHSEGGDD